jgi:3-phenylpropionate/cinnamic acid dioxygenase small subunit
MLVDAQLHHEISEVLIRYATGIDSKDWQLFRTCFTDDCELDYSPIGVWRSLDEVATFMEAVHASCPYTLHRITNVVVTGTGDGTATARSYVDALVLLDAATAAHPTGFYDDELVRTADGWRIARRRFTSVLMRVTNGVAAD